MASGIYNRFFANLMNKLIDIGSAGDTLKVMLLTSTHTFNCDHNQKSEIVANEISGTGYTAGGATLGSQTVTQDDANNKATFDAADTVWTTASFTTRHAVIYDDTLANDDLICNIDFTEDKVVSSGTFTIQWNASGIISLASA